MKFDVTINATIHLHQYVHGEPELGCKLDKVLSAVNSLDEKVSKIMPTLDEVLALVTEADQKDDALIALLNGIKQQLADVLSGTTLPPDVQAKVDAIFEVASRNAATISSAIEANTPPSP